MAFETYEDYEIDQMIAEVRKDFDKLKDEFEELRKQVAGTLQLKIKSPDLATEAGKKANPK